VLKVFLHFVERNTL